MNDYQAKLNEHMNRIKAWWMPLAIREKQAVIIGGVLIGVLLIYTLIWTPLSDHAAHLRKQIVTNEKTLQFMQAAENEIDQNAGSMSEAAAVTSPVDFLSYLQQQLASAGLTATQVKQSSQNSVTVTFQQVEFDKLLGLLMAIMKAQRVSVEQFTATAADSPGVANVALVLKLG